MDMILKKLLKKVEIIDTDIENALYDMCDTEHSSCNDNCIIYEMFCPEDKHNKSHWKCPYFKSPKKMLNKLRENPSAI